jgi:hypothetical protein
MLMIISLLFGAVLAQRCKVLVLVPAIVLVSVVTAIDAAGGGSTFWHILGATAVGIAALQVGYLAGLGLHHLLNVLQSALMRRSSFHGSVSSRRVAN